MSESEKLTKAFETTQWLVHKFAEGLSNEDSLARPQFKANNFNWVVGHMVVSRNRVLLLLGQPGVFSESEIALYDTGSDLVTAETAMPLERLLLALDSSQRAIKEALQSASDDDLAVVVGEERRQTILQRIEGLHWHETYHLGQLEILRQVSAAREAYP